MPLISKKSKNKDDSKAAANSKTPPATSAPTSNAADDPKPKLVFHCQLAHGSPTGLISGFTNVKELYMKIAECYDIDAKQILFCTLNTHKVDMNKLLGGQIGLDDFIFAHVKGAPKCVEIVKSESALGLTITDNGAGYAFIKRIKEGSIIDKTDEVKVGDHIEKINDKSLIGARHFEVAKMLKDIAVGAKFSVHLVEPTREGFLNISARGSKQQNTSKPMGNGKQTMRMKSGKVEEKDDYVDMAVNKINNLLESFMGINDSELAQTIWELGKIYGNPSDFAKSIEESEIGQFEFSEDFTFDLWGAINDARNGRLKPNLGNDKL